MQRRIRATDARKTLGPWLVSCASPTTDVGGCGGQHTLTLPPRLERGDLTVDPRGLRGSGVFERTTALFRGMFVRVYWLQDQPCCVLVLYVAPKFENTFIVKSKEMILTKTGQKQNPKENCKNAPSRLRTLGETPSQPHLSPFTFGIQMSFRCL